MRCTRPLRDRCESRQGFAPCDRATAHDAAARGEHRDTRIRAQEAEECLDGLGRLAKRDDSLACMTTPKLADRGGSLDVRICRVVERTE
jgi:hypothetical protein